MRRSKRDDVVKQHLYTNLWREDWGYLFGMHQVLEKRREHLSSFLKGFESTVFVLMRGFIVPPLTSARNEVDLLSAETVSKPMTSVTEIRESRVPAKVIFSYQRFHLTTYQKYRE